MKNKIIHTTNKNRNTYKKISTKGTGAHIFSNSELKKMLEDQGFLPKEKES